MITEVHMSGLRGIWEGRVDGMGPLVILVGPNGCGKSTILDALLMGAGNHPADAIGRAVQRRPYSWNGSRWLFHRKREDRTATIAVTRSEGRNGGEGYRETRLAWVPEVSVMLPDAFENQRNPRPYTTIVAEVKRGKRRGEVQTVLAANNRYHVHTLGAEPIRGWEMRIIDSPHGTGPMLDDVYTRAVEQGRKDFAVAAVREVLGADFRDITLLTDNRVPVVHVVFDDGSVPVSAAGEGVASLVRIALELAGRPRGTVLLEEPEAHQHPRIMWQTAEVVWATVKRDVQVILSTHSMELLDAFLATAPEDALEKLSVHRLALATGELGHTRIEGVDAVAMRSEFEDDLR